MQQPDAIETPENRMAGLLFIIGAAMALPLLLAYLFGAWSLAVAAWHLLTAQFTG